jgi:hypothetical protein
VYPEGIAIILCSAGAKNWSCEGASFISWKLALFEMQKIAELI